MAVSERRPSVTSSTNSERPRSTTPSSYDRPQSTTPSNYSDKSNGGFLSEVPVHPVRQVLTDPFLLKHILSYQKGTKYKDWTSGDIAARTGHTQLILDKNLAVSPRALNCLCAKGAWNTLETLKDSCGCGIGGTRAIDFAVTRNEATPARMQWLLESVGHKAARCSTSLAITTAASQGNLTLVQLLHKHGAECSPTAMDSAAGGGNFAVLEFLHNHRTEGCTKGAFDSACENGHLPIAIYLRDHRPEGCSHKALEGAAKNGHLDIVQWLCGENRANGTPRICVWNDKEETAMRPNSNSLLLAVKHGQLNVFKFLLEQDIFELDRDMADAACAGGFLAILSIMHEINPTLWPTLAGICAAVQGGHMELCQFLESKYKDALDLQWPAKDNFIMDAAAKSGKLELVCWLDDVKNTHFATNAFRIAAAHGHLSVVAWATEAGYACGPWTFDAAASGGHLEVLEYMQEHCNPQCSTLAMDRASLNGHLAVVMYLHSTRTEGCTKDALDGAARQGHFEVVEFLINYRKEGCYMLTPEHAFNAGHHEIADAIQACSNWAF